MLQLRRQLLRQLPPQLLCLQLLQNQCLPWQFGPALLQQLGHLSLHSQGQEPGQKPRKQAHLQAAVLHLLGTAVVPRHCWQQSALQTVMNLLLQGRGKQQGSLLGSPLGLLMGWVQLQGLQLGLFGLAGLQ